MLGGITGSISFRCLCLPEIEPVLSFGVEVLVHKALASN
jgi:hypothetical protein